MWFIFSVIAIGIGQTSFDIAGNTINQFVCCNPISDNCCREMVLINISCFFKNFNRCRVVRKRGGKYPSDLKLPERHCCYCFYCIRDNSFAVIHFGKPITHFSIFNVVVCLNMQPDTTCKPPTNFDCKIFYRFTAISKLNEFLPFLNAAGNAV